MFSNVFFTFRFTATPGADLRDYAAVSVNPITRSWAQNLFGKKHQFQNPLHQSYKHTMLLSEYLKIEHDKICSILFFIGDAELKSHDEDLIEHTTEL